MNLLESTSTQDATACHVQCKIQRQCAAFAFSSTSQATSENCCLYRKALNGGYNHGSNDNGVKCYVEPKGIRLRKI